MTVSEATSAANFKETVANNSVVLVDFHATWCGPCKAIAPKVKDWSEEYPNITYVKVDVDQLSEVAQEYNIRSMPTFLVFKDGEKVAEMTGAYPPKLLEMIKTNHPTEKK